MNEMYKHISGKIKEVFYADEGDTYCVIGDCTREQALKAIHRYERIELGIGKSDLYQETLQKVNLWEDKEEEMIYWKEPENIKVEPIGVGWIGRV